MAKQVVTQVAKQVVKWASPVCFVSKTGARKVPTERTDGTEWSNNKRTRGQTDKGDWSNSKGATDQTDKGAGQTVKE